MLFNSLQFLKFCPIVFCIYWIVPDKVRWIVILLSSYYFYMCWNAKYVALIFFATFVTYLGALFVDECINAKCRKLALLVCTLLCLGILFIFKYLGFFTTSIDGLLNLIDLKLNTPVFELLLPVGISFYTFQTLSYVIDVYRGEVEPEHNFGMYAAYISFFPQLVAGPIERTRNLLPQIRGRKVFDYDQATYGLKLMVWGLFKKMLIADMLSPYVDKVFENVYEFSGLSLVVASMFFSLQIYCDFSGYSDMAVGIAKLFGIDIMFNFKAPYFAKSVREFWSRWHISLSTWFRDYVYIPLGGNRCSKMRNSVNLILTFLVSGLWHGANWTYVVWGGIHGVAQVLEKRLVKKKFGIIGNLSVFVLVVVAFVFFRASKIEDALYVVTHYFSGILSPIDYLKNGYITLEITSITFIKLMIPVIILFFYDYKSLKSDVIMLIGSKNIILRWIVYIFFALMIMFYIQYFVGTGNVAQKFIYFDF